MCEPENKELLLHLNYYNPNKGNIKYLNMSLH